MTMPMFMTRLSYISLFSTEPKSEIFAQNTYFLFTPFSKILIACVVAFTAIDRFFRRLWTADKTSYETRLNKTKQAKKKQAKKQANRQNKLKKAKKRKIVKIAHIGSRTRSEDQFLYAKAQFILVPPIGVGRIFDWGGGSNRKSHAMTSSETSKQKFFVGAKIL